MSAITERVKGMPTMANRMQNSRPGVVTGAKWPEYEHDNPIQLQFLIIFFEKYFLLSPYPMVVRMVMTKKMAWL